MVPKYREDLFPTYTLTSDTEVVQFKTYYRKQSGSYDKVLVPGTVNPSAQGWYERQRNHIDEQRFQLRQYRAEHIQTEAYNLAKKLLEFPRWTADRHTTNDATPPMEFCHCAEFNDTKWNEVIGGHKPQITIAPFSSNLYIGRNIGDLIFKFIQLGAKLKTKAGWDSIKEDLNNWKTAMSALPTGDTYLEHGYGLDPTTFGTEGRVDDTYTLGYHWQYVNYNQCRYVLDSEIKTLTSIGTSVDVYKETVELIKTMFERSAQTIIEIYTRLGSLVVVNRETFNGEE